MSSSIIQRKSRSEFFKSSSILSGRSGPLSFDFEVTPRCNNNCRHCYINVSPGNSEARKSELSIDEIEHIADQAVGMGVLWCLLSGGEPLLRGDFEDIYMLLKRKGLLLSVYTNATLIDQRYVQLFKKYPPRLLEVTVYGTSEKTYGRVTRRPDLFGAFLRGLDLLVQNNIPVRLKAMALRSNFRELPDIAEFSRKYTKDYYRFDPLLHLRYDGNAERNEEIISERLSAAEIAEIEHADPERSTAMQEDCHIFIKESVRPCRCDHLLRCGAGLDSFSLSWDGRFRLCSSLCAPSCSYDLKTGTLDEAWNHFRPRIRDMRAGNPEYAETCGNCSVFNLCPWCVANSYLESGRFDRKSEYFCEVAHARAEKLADKIAGRKKA